MLSKIRIQNFALIEDLTLNFENKLVVFSGETGSGKSILINAINFLIGERADKTFIRSGTEYAQVEGVFNTDKEIVKKCCEDYGISFDNELIVTRKISLDGKNEIRINGVLVTLLMLKNITTHLVDIYGQHQHQVLLDVNTHIKFIDGYSYPKQLDNLKEVITDIKEIDKQLSVFGGDESAREREKDILQFELQELEEANLRIGEDDELEIQKKKFNNMQKIVEAISSASSYLSENDNSMSVSGCLYNSEKLLNSVSNIDTKIDELASRINSAKLEIEDITDGLNQLLQDYDFNEQEYEQMENRLDILKNIKRKYGGSIASALQYQQDSEQKLSFLLNSVEQIEKLTAQKNNLIKQGWELCKQITCDRQKNAIEIEQKMLLELSQLGMKNAKLVVDFKPLENFTENGADIVEFMFSANEGEPLKPLTKVISGGEMSRFMLAFKTVMENVNSIPTMIFDEIDNGIGGEIGFAVACKIAKIAQKVQVFVVTHLASIGAMAEQHFKIQKQTNNGRTNTHVTLLTEQQQIEEIMRLSGGLKGQEALNYARQLKERAKQVISD